MQPIRNSRTTSSAITPASPLPAASPPWRGLTIALSFPPFPIGRSSTSPRRGSASRKSPMLRSATGRRSTSARRRAKTQREGSKLQGQRPQCQSFRLLGDNRLGRRFQEHECRRIDHGRGEQCRRLRCEGEPRLRRGGLLQRSDHGARPRRRLDQDHQHHRGGRRQAHRRRRGLQTVRRSGVPRRGRDLHR